MYILPIISANSIFKSQKTVSQIKQEQDRIESEERNIQRQIEQLNKEQNKLESEEKKSKKEEAELENLNK